LEQLPHRVLDERTRGGTTWTPLGTEGGNGPIGQGVLVIVEPLGDDPIRELASGIPLEGQLYADGLDRVRDKDLSISTIWAAVVGAIVLAVGVGTGGAVALAVAEGRAAVVETLTGALELSLAGFLAKVVNIDLSQGAQDGEGELAPRGGEVEVLAHGDEGDAMRTELIERGEAATQVTIEAVQFIHYQDIELARAGIPHHLLKGRAVTVPAGRTPSIGVDMHQVPATAGAEGEDRVGLSLQAVPVHLLLVRNTGVSGRTHCLTSCL
jgi:hypothetical protein